MSHTTLTPSLDSTPAPPAPPLLRMKGSLLGHPLLKDLFLRHDVQVGEGRVQQVEVGVFVHGSAARKTGKYLKSGSMKNKIENTAVREKDM